MEYTPELDTGAASVERAGEAATGPRGARRPAFAATLHARAQDSEAATLRARAEGDDAATLHAQAQGDDASARRETETIGRFAVLRRLGEGGMGTVFSAFDEELERRVAIKVLKTGELLSEDAKQRMLREARALARISHPNVVPVYEVGEHDGGIYIAMEYIKGKTLGDWINPARNTERPGVPRPWEQVVKMFIETGKGLAAAHAAGLVHRDFKPDNVLVGDDGRPRVLDFGLVRAHGKEKVVTRSLPSLAESLKGLSVTMSGSLLGTPAYMSPEQHNAEEVEAASDQFSFCVALYEGIYGERPFRASTLLDLCEKVNAGEIDPPERSITAPLKLRQAIRRGLST
ncbi:MAG: serine/threonine protein kinase, partial [Myxococcales bacterium]|nr:serine/threonine protein kinase [Myxococcales bacterium]